MGICERDRARVNIDEMLRIGSILERNYLEQRKREAFDWLAQYRELMDEKHKEFAQHLNTALGDLVMSRELLKKALYTLMDDEIITQAEYDKNFRRFENCPDDQLPTVAQISYILKHECVYFQSEEH